MIRYRTVNEFYSALLSNHAVNLDHRWQRHIVEYANRTRKHNLLGGLLKRGDVADDVVAELAGHPAAAVKSAWLARHVDDIDVITAAVEGETRGAVLASIISEERLPEELFGSILANSTNIELIISAIGTGRATEDAAYEALAKISSTSKVIGDKNLTRLNAQLETYPKLFDTLVEHTRNPNVVAAALPRVSAWATDELLLGAVRRTLDTLLADGTLDYDELRDGIGVLRALASSAVSPDQVSQVVGTYIAKLRDAGAALLQPPHGYVSLSLQLDELDAGLVDFYDELADGLNGRDSAALSVLAAARARASVDASVSKRSLGYSTMGQRRLYMRLICDTVYSAEVRQVAVTDMCKHARSAVPSVFTALQSRQTPITVAMAATMYAGGHTEHLDTMLKLVDDRAALFDRLITEVTESHLGSRLIIQLDALGELTDTRVAALAERIPSSWYAEVPFEHPAISRVVEAGLAVAVDELGERGAGWEFFEACFGTVSANPAVLAKLSSTAE